MIRKFGFIFIFFLSICISMAQTEEFLTDVKQMSEAEITTFQNIFDPCIYDANGNYVDGCTSVIEGSVVFNSFSKSDVQEAYVAIGRDCGGCFSGRLFRKEKSEWKIISESLGYYGDACLSFTTSTNRNLLACYANSRAEDDTSVEIWVWNFSSDTSRNTLLLFLNPWAFDGNLCTTISQNEEAVVTHYEPINWMRTDFNGDGNKDLYFTLNAFEITSEDCTARGGNIESWTIASKNLHKVEINLVWLFDGETFIPTPETKAFIDGLEQEQ